MQRKKRILFAAVLLFSFLFTITMSLQAQVPRTISFQGSLTNPDGSKLPDGTVSLDFMLYESETGGTAIWTETQSANVKNGIFSVSLGKVTPLTAAFDKPYWVGIKVNGNSELIPRIALTASPYSCGTATVTQPEPGQNFQVKDSTGKVTHTLNSNGDSWSAGVGKFENGLVVGDTTVVPDTSHLSMTNTKKIKFGINKTLGANKGGRIAGILSGIFGWGKGNYIGVLGQSETGTGVFGKSTSSEGVFGTSSSGRGVSGSSNTGDGIYGSSFLGLAGHFGMGDVWIQQSLKIDDVPPTTETNYVIWSADHLLKVNNTPPTGGSFDGVLKNKPLKVQGPGPNPTDVISLNTDGTSSQTGKATLEDGFQIPFPGGGSVTVNATGTETINITNSSNTSVFKVNTDGTSNQTGKATFLDGIKLQGDVGSMSVGIYGDFNTPINVTDANNTSVWKVNSDGTSNQTGLATYNTGLKVLIPNGGNTTIYGTGNDAIEVTDANNVSKWKLDQNGSTSQSGQWSYMGPNNNDVTIGGAGDDIIDVRDPNNTNVFTVFNDGRTSQAGPGSFNAGWSTTLNNGNTAELSPVDGWHIKDANGNFVTHNDPDGNAFFAGDVTVLGNVYKGGGTFKIDHPLDPLNKYLYHSFVESPDMMNVYNGNIILDENGEATVKLPDWFDALNKEFRYQLTAIGAPGPNLYVSQKVKDNAFMIAGGKTGMEVSWQVTGIRHDAYANLHRIKVEEEKPIGERGKYLHPDAFKQSVVNNK